MILTDNFGLYWKSVKEIVLFVILLKLNDCLLFLKYVKNVIFKKPYMVF